MIGTHPLSAAEPPSPLACSSERKTFTKTGWIRKTGTRASGGGDSSSNNNNANSAGGHQQQQQQTSGSRQNLMTMMVMNASGSKEGLHSSGDGGGGGLLSLLPTNPYPPPSQADIVASKNRFFVLSDFRLKYYSTENVSSSSSGSRDAGALGVLYLTGDASCVSMDSTTLCVTGDSALASKQGKRYILLFKTVDDKIGWEFGLRFYLKRCLLADRIQRSFLYGWAGVYPTLAADMDTSSTKGNSSFSCRRVSISVVKKQPAKRLVKPNSSRITNDDCDDDHVTSKEDVAEGVDREQLAADAGNNMMPDGASVRKKLQMTPPAAASSSSQGAGGGNNKAPPSDAESLCTVSDRGDEDDEDDDDVLLVMSDDGDGSGTTDVNSDDEEFLEATLRVRRPEEMEARGLLEEGEREALSKADPAAVFIAAVNLCRGHFLLRFREEDIGDGQAPQAGRASWAYLSATWVRCSSSLDATLQLQLTPHESLAARFAIEIFALVPGVVEVGHAKSAVLASPSSPPNSSPPGGGGGAPVGRRIVLVEYPNYQLASLRGTAPRELALALVNPTLSVPSPVLVAATGGGGSSGSKGKPRLDVGAMAAAAATRLRQMASTALEHVSSLVSTPSLSTDTISTRQGGNNHHGPPPRAPPGVSGFSGQTSAAALAACAEPLPFEVGVWEGTNRMCLKVSNAPSTTTTAANTVSKGAGTVLIPVIRAVPRPITFSSSSNLASSAAMGPAAMSIFLVDELDAVQVDRRSACVLEVSPPPEFYAEGTRKRGRQDYQQSIASSLSLQRAGGGGGGTGNHNNSIKMWPVTRLHESVLASVKVVVVGASGAGKSLVVQHLMWMARERLPLPNIITAAVSAMGTNAADRHGTTTTTTSTTGAPSPSASHGTEKLPSGASSSPPRAAPIPAGSGRLGEVTGGAPVPAPSSSASTTTTGSTSTTSAVGATEHRFFSLWSGVITAVSCVDVPGSATADLIRSHCATADMVLCVFDYGDTFSLQWIEKNITSICRPRNSNNKNISNIIGREQASNIIGRKHASAAPHPQESSSAPPSGGGGMAAVADDGTQFILVGTRAGGSKMALDSYRIDEFFAAIAEYGVLEQVDGDAGAASCTFPESGENASPASSSSFLQSPQHHRYHAHHRKAAISPSQKYRRSINDRVAASPFTSRGAGKFDRAGGGPSLADTAVAATEEEEEVPVWSLWKVPDMEDCGAAGCAEVVYSRLATRLDEIMFVRFARHFGWTERLTLALYDAAAREMQEHAHSISLHRSMTGASSKKGDAQVSLLLSSSCNSSAPRGSASLAATPQMFSSSTSVSSALQPLRQSVMMLLQGLGLLTLTQFDAAAEILHRPVHHRRAAAQTHSHGGQICGKAGGGIGGMQLSPSPGLFYQPQQQPHHVPDHGQEEDLRQRSSGAAAALMTGESSPTNSSVLSPSVLSSARHQLSFSLLSPEKSLFADPAAQLGSAAAQPHHQHHATGGAVVSWGVVTEVSEACLGLHWQVLKWLLAGLGSGDVRAEVILLALKNAAALQAIMEGRHREGSAAQLGQPFDSRQKATDGSVDGAHGGIFDYGSYRPASSRAPQRQQQQQQQTSLKSTPAGSGSSSEQNTSLLLLCSANVFGCIGRFTSSSAGSRAHPRRGPGTGSSSSSFAVTHLVPKNVALLFDLVGLVLAPDAVQQLHTSMDLNSDEIVDRRDVDGWLRAPEMAVVPVCAYWAMVAGLWKHRAARAPSQLLHLATFAVVSSTPAAGDGDHSFSSSHGGRVAPLAAAGAASRPQQPLTLTATRDPRQTEARAALAAAAEPLPLSARCRRCGADAALFRSLRQCHGCGHAFCQACCSAEVITLNERNETVRAFSCSSCLSRGSASAGLPPLPPDEGHGSDGGDAKAAKPSSTSSLTTNRDAAVAVWDEDASTALCSLCTERFTLLRRRHHCRRCGAVVCGACSPHTAAVPGYDRPQRVCSVCHRATPSRAAAGPAVLPSTSSVSSQAVREAGGESTESDTSSVAAKGEKEPSACAGADSTGHRQQPLVGDSVGERCRVGGGGGGLSATAAMPATPQELHALVMRGVPAGAYAAVPDASEEWRARIRAARRRAAVPDAEYELPWRDTYGSDEEREVLGRAAKTIRGRLAEVASWAPAFSRQAKERYEMAVPRQEYVVLQPGYLEADDAAEESVDLGHFEAMCPSDAGPSGAA